MSTVALVGSPRVPSRTRVVAEHVLQAVGGGKLIDLAEPGLRQGLVQTDPRPQLGGAFESVTGADLLIVTSPTHKAAYTGLLKCFLDLLPANALAGKRVLPLMLGASEAHRLTVEFTLKPVIGELGGHCPPRGLYLVDRGVHLDPPGPDAALQDQIAAWLTDWPFWRSASGA